VSEAFTESVVDRLELLAAIHAHESSVVRRRWSV
jgi:hypothetical protein